MNVTGVINGLVVIGHTILAIMVTQKLEGRLKLITSDVN